MLCSANNEFKSLGFIEVKTHDVILACRNIIRDIDRMRSNMRRDYVTNHMASSEKWWKYFWRMLGFSRPTRRNAIADFYGVGLAFDIQMLCGRQYFKCKALLRAASATSQPTMLISVDSAHMLCL